LILNPPRMYSLLLNTVNPPGRIVPMAPGQSSPVKTVEVSVTGRQAAEALEQILALAVRHFDEPAPVHHAARVPVLLDNPRWLRPFELFLGIFDPPKYGTFDPTIFFAIGLPLWVGLIIGDVGYGLVLLAATRWIGAKAAAGRAWRAVVAGMDFGFTMSPAVLRSVATVLSWMTAWTFLFGIVFGEFFGDLPARWVNIQSALTRSAASAGWAAAHR